MNEIKSKREFQVGMAQPGKAKHTLIEHCIYETNEIIFILTFVLP